MSHERVQRAQSSCTSDLLAATTSEVGARSLLDFQVTSFFAAFLSLRAASLTFFFIFSFCVHDGAGRPGWRLEADFFDGCGHHHAPCGSCSASTSTAVVWTRQHSQPSASALSQVSLYCSSLAVPHPLPDFGHLVRARSACELVRVDRSTGKGSEQHG